MRVMKPKMDFAFRVGRVDYIKKVRNGGFGVRGAGYGGVADDAREEVHQLGRGCHCLRHLLGSDTIVYLKIANKHAAFRKCLF